MIAGKSYSCTYTETLQWKQFCSFIFYFLSIELKEILIQECVICWFATQNGKIQIVQLMLIVLPETEELLNSAKMP